MQRVCLWHIILHCRSHPSPLSTPRSARSLPPCALRPAVADPQASLLALRLVCRASYVPRAALQLVQASGLIPWLAAAACRAVRAAGHQGLQQPQQLAGSGGGWGPGGLLWPPREALGALLRLTRLRAVARPGAREAHADLLLAVQHLAAALGVPAGGQGRAVACRGGHGLEGAGVLPGDSAATGELGALFSQLEAAVRGLVEMKGDRARAGAYRHGR